MSIAEATVSSVLRPYLLPVAGKSVSAACALEDEDLQMLRRIGSKLRFDRGETIFSEGDAAEHAYRVVKGAVRLCKHMADGRRQIAQFLLPGDFFSFMEISEHSFTAEAVSDTTLISYPLRQIARLGEERPSLRRRFSTLLSQRVRDIQNHLVILGRQTAREKVASFLLFLIEHEGSEQEILLNVPMNRQDIADFLGLTIETVCRVLSAMKRDGLVEISSLHQLAIKDIDALYAVAEGENA